MNDQEYEIVLKLTRDQCFELAAFINEGVLDTLHNDPDIDNIRWVVKWSEVIDGLESVGKEDRDD